VVESRSVMPAARDFKRSAGVVSPARSCWRRAVREADMRAWALGFCGRVRRR
jgi:hypothetical protein